MSNRTRTRRATTIAAVVPALALGSIAAPALSGVADAATTYRNLPYSQTMTLSDKRITESSGLVASKLHSGVLWTHNDSGDSARLFAVGSGGPVKAVLTLSIPSPTDWEAVGMGKDSAGRPALFVGDIGDNGLRRSTIKVHVVTEPSSLKSQTAKPVTYVFRYPDGKHNAEALLVHPTTNQIYVVTKATSGGAVYKAPTGAKPGVTTTLTKVASVGKTVVSDAGFLRDGRPVLRSYGKAIVYGNASFSSAQSVIYLPSTKLGESLAVATDNSAVFVGSEGSKSPVYKVRLP